MITPGTQEKEEKPCCKASKASGQAAKPCCSKKQCGEEKQQQKAGKAGGKCGKEAEQVPAEKESESGSEDESMEEALADYAAARDTVLSAAKKELGELVR